MSYCSCFNRVFQWFTDCSEDEVFGRGSEETTNSMATYVKILVEYGVLKSDVCFGRVWVERNGTSSRLLVL